jgi:uncharacterized membrane protein (UPF0127 family)
VAAEGEDEYLNRLWETADRHVVEPSRAPDLATRLTAGAPPVDVTRWALRGVLALLVVVLGACLAVGADRPPDPHFITAAQAAALAGHSSARSRVAGFGQIGFRVIRADGNAGPVRCALYADTPASRARGMTGRRDLAGYDAMLFRFFSDSTSEFFNKGVPIPLSVAWFDGSGVFVGRADLAVCPAVCPTVGPALPYRLAIEVPAGGLRHLGIGQGSVLQVGGSCG